MANREQDVQVSDTTKRNSSNAVGVIKKINNDCCDE